MWIQEIRVGRQNIALGSSGRRYACCAENVAVAERIVGMIENVKDVGPQLQIFYFVKINLLGERDIERRKTGCREAVTPQIGLSARSGNNVFGAKIYRSVANGREKGAAGWVSWIETRTASRDTCRD